MKIGLGFDENSVGGRVRKGWWEGSEGVVDRGGGRGVIVKDEDKRLPFFIPGRR